MTAPSHTALRVRAHPNIALVKYWGKQQRADNWPATESLSLTLEPLETVTALRLRTGDDACVRGATDTTYDIVEGLGPEAAARARAFVAAMRAMAKADSKVDHVDAPLVVHTQNNFPTAAGLASSASGFAALIVALDAMWGWRLPPGRLSALARRGSGSAARSVFGGIVRMRLFADPQQEPSAQPLLREDAWPLRVLVAVVDAKQKDMGSTLGMQQTQTTSPYYDAWVSSHAQDMQTAVAAIEQRDFTRLAEVTEHSCLKMHASMMAARPGILYWHPTTLALVHEVRRLRQRGLAAAFTIDAGPQVKIVCEQQDEQAIRDALRGVAGVQHWISCGLGKAPRIEETAP